MTPDQLAAALNDLLVATESKLAGMEDVHRKFAQDLRNILNRAMKPATPQEETK